MRVGNRRKQVEWRTPELRQKSAAVCNSPQMPVCPNARLASLHLPSLHRIATQTFHLPPDPREGGTSAKCTSSQKHHPPLSRLRPSPRVSLPQQNARSAPYPRVPLPLDSPHRNKMHIQLQNPDAQVELVRHRQPLVVGLQLMLGALAGVGVGGEGKGSRREGRGEAVALRNESGWVWACVWRGRARHRVCASVCGGEGRPKRWGRLS